MDVTLALICLTATVLLGSFLVPMLVNVEKVQGSDQVGDGLPWSSLRQRLATRRVDLAEVDLFLGDVPVVLEWAGKHPERFARLRRHAAIPLSELQSWDLWDYLELSPAEYLAASAKLTIACEIGRAGKAQAIDGASARLAELRASGSKDEADEQEAWLEQLRRYPEANLAVYRQRAEKIENALASLVLGQKAEPEKR